MRSANRLARKRYRITANAPLALTAEESGLVGCLRDVLPVATGEVATLTSIRQRQCGTVGSPQLQDARGASAAVVVTVAPFEAENLLISLQPAQSNAVSPSPDESLLDSLPVAAFATDAVGIITYANASWRELLGTPPGESTHRHLLDCEEIGACAARPTAVVGAEIAGFEDHVGTGWSGAPRHIASRRGRRFAGHAGTLQELRERCGGRAGAADAVNPGSAFPGRGYWQARRLSQMSSWPACRWSRSRPLTWLVTELNTTSAADTQSAP